MASGSPGNASITRIFVLVSFLVTIAFCAARVTLEKERPHDIDPPSVKSDHRDAAIDINAMMDNWVRVRRRMTIGCERPGVRLDLVLKGPACHPQEGSERIRLSEGGHVLFVKHLNDLQGHVAIHDSQTALKYVRLLTSSETWFIWNEGPCALEVLERNEARNIPRFGLHEEITLEEWGDVREGIMGVLSAHTFHAAGFSHPVVTRTDHGFTIVRWLYVEPERDRGLVEKVKESVGEDGSYSRTILIQKKPALPSGVEFYIARFA